MAEHEVEQTRNDTLIAENGERAIDRFEIRKPDGIWTPMFRGQDTIHDVQGGDVVAPAHPTFPTEEQAREWLAARTD